MSSRNKPPVNPPQSTASAAGSAPGGADAPPQRVVDAPDRSYNPHEEGRIDPCFHRFIAGADGTLLKVAIAVSSSCGKRRSITIDAGHVAMRTGITVSDAVAALRAWRDRGSIDLAEDGPSVEVRLKE